MTVYAITDTKKGRTGIAPTYLQTTPTPHFLKSFFFPWQGAKKHCMAIVLCILLLRTKTNEHQKRSITHFA